MAFTSRPAMLAGFTSSAVYAAVVRVRTLLWENIAAHCVHPAGAYGLRLLEAQVALA